MVPYPNEPIPCDWCVRNRSTATYYSYNTGTSTSTMTISCCCRSSSTAARWTVTVPRHTWDPPKLNHEARRKERAISRERRRKRKRPEVTVEATHRPIPVKESEPALVLIRQWPQALQHFRRDK